MFLISSNVAMWWCDPCVAYFCSFGVLQEHYYDAESGSGYLAWRIKTVQRNTAVQSQRCSTSTTYGPKSKRDFLLADKQLFGKECREAISLLKHSTDVSVVKDKMMATFQYRQTLAKPCNSLGWVSRHPRLGKKDIPLFDQLIFEGNNYGSIYFQYQGLKVFLL